MSPWFREYLIAKNPGALWDAREDLAVRVCMHFAQAEKLAEHVIQSADAFIRDHKCTPANAKTLFFALDKTGEDKYREAIQQVMTELDAQMVDVSDLLAACEALPFRMAYEMKLNRMERVGQTAAMFRDVHNRLWNARAGRHDAALREEAWFLMALMDAVECCSDQLYEHWRALVDIYRVMLTGMLRAAEEADPQTLALLLYALLRGVQQELIDPERYLPVARRGIETLRQNGESHAAEVLERIFGVSACLK